MEDIEHYGDPPCTDCGDTGVTHQTERPCACAAGMILETERSKPATDLAKAIERVCGFADERDMEALLMSGKSRDAYQAWIADIRTVCDAAERASRVSVEDVARAFWNSSADEFNQWDELDSDEKKRQVAGATAVMAPLRGEGRWN